MRINIIIPDKDLQLIDDYCERNGFKRSGFLVMSAKKVILNEVPKIPRPLPIEKERVPQNHVQETVPNSISDTSVEDLIPDDVKKTLVDDGSVFSDEKKDGYHFNSTLGRYVKD